MEGIIRESDTIGFKFCASLCRSGLYWLLRGANWGDLNAKQVLDSALPFLQKAVTLDSNLASVHHYFAQVHLWYQLDFKAAEKEWKKFFQLNPSGARWAGHYQAFLAASGRFTEALNFSLKSFEQDKTQWGHLADAAFNYFYLGYPEKAQAIVDTLWSVGEEPYIIQIWLSLWLGKYQQALDNLNKYFEKYPDKSKTSRIQA